MKDNDLLNKPQCFPNIVYQHSPQDLSKIEWQHTPRSFPHVVINTSVLDKEDNEEKPWFVPESLLSLSRPSVNSIDQQTPDLFLEKIEKKLSLVFAILILELIISLITALALVF